MPHRASQQDPLVLKGLGTAAISPLPRPTMRQGKRNRHRGAEILPIRSGAHQPMGLRPARTGAGGGWQADPILSQGGR